MGSQATILAKAQEQRTRRSSQGFGLLEILVVIVIIAVLAVLLIPVARSLVAKADSAKCVGNLRQIAAGLQLYVNDHGGSFPPYSDNSGRWMPKILVDDYALDRRIFYCPTMKNMRWQNPDDPLYRTDYGYNYQYIGSKIGAGFYPNTSAWKNAGRPTPKNVSIRVPSQVVLFVENFYYAGAPPRTSGTTLGLWKDGGEARLDPRHQTRMNILWADFHITQESVIKASSGAMTLPQAWFMVK